MTERKRIGSPEAPNTLDVPNPHPTIDFAHLQGWGGR